MIPEKENSQDLQQKESRLSSNLRTLMHHHKLNESKLSRITLIPQPTVHKILTGRTSDPRVSTLKILSEYFKTSVDELFSGIVSLSPAHPIKKTQSIPILRWDDFEKGGLCPTKFNASNWGKWISVDTPGELYALISKPSMSALFPKGTIIIVEAGRAPEDGNLIIAKYPGSGKAALKKWIADGPKQYLRSILLNTPNDELVGEIKILGVVVESRYSYVKDF